VPARGRYRCFLSIFHDLALKSVEMGKFFVGLLIVIGFGLIILVTLGIGVLGWGAPEAEEEQEVRIPPSPVAVRKVELEPIEIIRSYSGMIRPMERFGLGFEIAGRVMELGVNRQGEPLDEGDRVGPGDLLARLDNRVLVARLKEAKAQLEQSQADLNRVRLLESRQPGAVSQSELDERRTASALAQAQFDMAEKNLEDARLVWPAKVPGVISKRLVKPGESVTPHETVFEVIQVDEVLLVVGVPESEVSEIRVKQPVHVELFARDRFRQRRPRLEGRVQQVGEAADDTTGLFEVEIKLPNPDGRLKPGLIALGRIVIDSVEGFRVSVTNAVFRGDETFLFTVGEDEKAHRFVLDHYIEQGPDLILSQLPPAHRLVVVRGQHRLVEGRPVEVVPSGTEGPIEMDREIPVRTPATASKP